MKRTAAVLQPAIIPASPSIAWVDLSPHEFRHACGVAIERQLDNILNNRRHAWGAKDSSGWDYHIIGACGEMAAAKHLGAFWSGAIGNLDAADIGSLFDVRATADHRYSLLIHPSDPDERPFILATGGPMRFCLRGWMCGQEAKQMQWWEDRSGRGRPAFFVPQAALHPMSTII